MSQSEHLGIDVLLRDGIAMMEVLDEGRTPWQSVEDFADQARATIPVEHTALFESEVAAEGHGQYEPGDQSRIAGILDGLAAAVHAIHGWDQPQHVPGPVRAWLPSLRTVTAPPA